MEKESFFFCCLDYHSNNGRNGNRCSLVFWKMPSHLQLRWCNYQCIKYIFSILITCYRNGFPFLWSPFVRRDLWQNIHLHWKLNGLGFGGQGQGRCDLTNGIFSHNSKIQSMFYFVLLSCYILYQKGPFHCGFDNAMKTFFWLIQSNSSGAEVTKLSVSHPWWLWTDIDVNCDLTLEAINHDDKLD